MPQNLGPVGSDPDIPTKKYVDDGLAGKAATSHNHDSAYVNRSGDVMSGNLQTPRILARDHSVHRDGLPRQNLGDPTVYEAALFDSQIVNRTLFHPRSKASYEYTMDGTNWVADDVSDLLHTRLFAGADVSDGASHQIPNGCVQYRITLESTGYCYLNDLYMYMSPNAHRTRIQLFRRRNSDETWYEHTPLSQEVSGWPAHVHIPHSTITFNPSNASQHAFVRIEFTPRWIMDGGQYETWPIYLYSVEWWGGYPKSRRTLFSYDSDKNFRFPNNVRVDGTPTATTDLTTKQYVDQGLSGKANTSHAHPTSDVTGLDTALAGKAPTSHTHTTAQVTGLDTALAGKAATSHTHDDRYFTESEVTTKLAGKADSAHTHPYLPLSGGALDGDLDLTWHSITTVWDVQTSNLTGNPDVVGGDISLNNSLNANGNRIYGVVAPAAGDQAANKGYVDGAAQVHVGTAEPTNPNVLLWIDTGA